MGSEYRVRLEPSPHAGLERVLTILRQRIEERCPTRVVEGTRQPHLILTIDGSLPARLPSNASSPSSESFPPDAFRIDEHRGSLRITGATPRAVLYGVGKFLRTSQYSGGLQPSPWRGVSVPRGRLRGVYFASHFHNWYHTASEPEIVRYVEDLALWGANAIWTSFPAMNLQGWSDPEAGDAIAMVRKYGRVARGLGMHYGTGLGNTWFSGTPKEVLAKPLPDPTGRRGNHGFPVCPSLPAGQAYLLENTRRLFEALRDPGLDLAIFWPYDEGGCSCEQCRPWGSNGYLRVTRDLTRLAREYFPGLETVLSTWMFDTPPEGEWAGLSRTLASGGEWIDAILADAHEDFPRYPLDVEVPGARPLVNFPEISMWGNWPWGGFGANPLPSRFQRLWDQVKSKVSGGFPYSEGIYEDMNKAVVLQFYWDRDRSARETLAEYGRYELGARVEADVLRLVERLEDTASRSFQKRPTDRASVEAAAVLAESIEQGLPDWGRKGWRWEILKLRAILDRERFGGAGLESPAAEAALLRLIDIYHAQLDTNDPYHHRVRPPLKRAVSRRGNH